MKEDMERVRMVIRHFADYVLLDSCAYQSAGFITGKLELHWLYLNLPVCWMILFWRNRLLICFRNRF